MWTGRYVKISIQIDKFLVEYVITHVFSIPSMNFPHFINSNRIKSIKLFPGILVRGENFAIIEFFIDFRIFLVWILWINLLWWFDSTNIMNEFELKVSIERCLKAIFVAIDWNTYVTPAYFQSSNATIKVACLLSYSIHNSI